MRIATVGPQQQDEAFALVIAHELRELGHEVTAIDSRPKRLDSGRAGKVARQLNGLTRLASPDLAAWLGRRIERQIGEFEPGLIITVEGYWSGAELDRWRQAAGGAQIVWWFPDHIANLEGQRFLTVGFDHVFLKDRLAVEALRDGAGLNEVHFLAQGCRTNIPESWLNRPDEFDVADSVVVAANYYPSRVRLLQQVAPSCPLALFGNTENLPPSLLASDRQRYLTGRDKFGAFGHARAVLNDQYFAELGGVNLRLFEAARAGALVVTRSTPTLAEYFTSGSEVLAYSNVEELEAILRSDLTEAKSTLGAKARARAIAEHTMERRLRELLEVVDVSPVVC